MAVNVKLRTKPVGYGRIAKVPVVIQMEVCECGAASLAMILAYYGRWITLEEMRSDCGVSRDGSTALSLIRGARHHGLNAKGYKMEPEELARGGTFPCIVHMGFTHFIVVTGIKGKVVYANDPGKGRIKIPFDKFNEQFTGVVLFFEPSESFVAKGGPVSIYTYVAERLKGTKSAITLAVITTVIASLTAFLTPGFYGIFIDKILSGQQPGWIYPMLGIFAIVVVIQLIAAFIKSIQLLKIEGKMAIVSETSFFWHVLNLPMDFFAQRMAGDIQQRQITNSTIAYACINQLAPIVINALLMVVYLIFLVGYSPLLAAIGLLAVFINGFIAGWIARKKIDITRSLNREQGRKIGATVAGINIIRTIKSSGAERGYFEKWAGYQAAEFEAADKVTRVNAYQGNLPTFITEFFGVVILGIGAYLTFQGEFTVGMLMAFQGFLTEFNTPVAGLIETGQNLEEMKVNMERTDDVMKYHNSHAVVPQPESMEGFEGCGKLKGNVIIKDVTFGYSPLGNSVINNFSLELTPGKTVALVGNSGCGKSTIARLMAGLYKPWEGEIFFDGYPISEIPHPLFGSSIAVVDQDVVLFEDTIRNNIKLWDESIADFEMILAARDAQIHNDITDRPGGYDSILLENGGNLSGGQKQRIEIARVLAQEPNIIILDEATSALDAMTEYEVMKAIKKREITCIVVAHRLSTIRDCDEIIYMEDGRIAERGTHEELYALGGGYAGLVSNE